MRWISLHRFTSFYVFLKVEAQSSPRLYREVGSSVHAIEGELRKSESKENTAEYLMRSDTFPSNQDPMYLLRHLLTAPLVKSDKNSLYVVSKRCN